LGQHELKVDTVAEQLKDNWKWQDLMGDAKLAVEKAVNTMEAKWESTQEG
jgi:hypothetical protein